MAVQTHVVNTYIIHLKAVSVRKLIAYQNVIEVILEKKIKILSLLDADSLRAPFKYYISKVRRVQGTTGSSTQLIILKV